ncbi:RNA polymerase sigma factor [Nocardia beijingensis]
MMDDFDYIGGADVRVPPTSPPPQTTSDVAQREEFRAFYREFTPVLIGFLMVYHGARQADAADVVQETMTKAWKSWPTIDSPKAWARKVAGRELARRVGSIEEDQIDESEHSAVLPSSSDSAIDEWLVQDEFYCAVSVLPPRQRQVMAWTMEGYKPAEIADVLKLPPATVRSNLRKARRAIAIYLNRSAQQ